MEDVINPEYWSVRNTTEKGHRRIYKCDPAYWEKVENVHREILKEEVKQDDSILDIGCGWGRLLTLLPEGWEGAYLGIDLCREFVQEARRNNPGRPFIVGDAIDVMTSYTYVYDVAVLISIIPMLVRNVGTDYADKLLESVRRRAKKVLLLEYDPNDFGTYLEGLPQ